MFPKDASNKVHMKYAFIRATLGKGILREYQRE